MDTIPVGPSFNPTTQGKVHPLQKDDENFLGYFNKRFFEQGITHASKRIVLDDPENPYRNLHESIRCYPVFVNHIEALERHYALRVGVVAKEAVCRLREALAQERVGKQLRMGRFNRIGLGTSFLLLASTLCLEGAMDAPLFLVVVLLALAGLAIFSVRTIRDLLGLGRSPTNSSRTK
ncbi:MAG: hypothetical protein A3C93_01640 [Candidatus Lloydbacteria bacterium RIFCSPHIGHO2_02_FULL_54_17]|uniref:Uncharacterized protein n=1 Tax=Candidatus Lloydbacteria bacterium RIFCSPHIGHO2_02_FULL_54_17 TaxID=1798664 RepID=A0A1G2DBT2_9BACT|nr:MAG: hypothetical protein A2762_02820 [Candidatus Lloydbacteria bacterium RIFCSPHIGHO2_01_FULL_54_11]OGZ11056.1 MAG: hypothetical protein A3C93_01640 [Candidatus Lloydbacteria bacterium RIFCSPHIGHO2_02_FULL_54_17]OGZ14455.1 MAG: hypothetical protein A3H76_06155 [Candidatus Lloydbacteria bacterium RIFCSPLOWO2_02_FULL_54_12]OGZ15471.1 MAG: hypothetical protein A2948_02760 [Candidatus Lloydbacteria bacterium RIFCSPLOWO2_01_FULL_54_18]